MSGPAASVADVAPDPAPPERPTVLLVDDDAMSRAGLGSILRSGGLDVVGECEDGDQVLDAVRRLRPAVVLMDLRMRRVGGLDATALLHARLDAPPAVVAVTSLDTDDLVARSLRAGAVGFLGKDERPAAFVAAVRAAAAGLAVMTPGSLRRVATRTAAAPATEEALRSLTERETDVLRCLGAALDNRQIATELVVEESTVKTHVGNVVRKLGAANRVHAAIMAVQAGLVAS
ncbi:response regulator transcription factor [Rhodococcus aerolatus]